jgi:hypothetical protein
MRRRRAATCVRVARQAIAEGRVLDAEDRLDEACRLDPDETEAQLLLEELQAARVADLGGVPVERRGGAGGWSHWLAACVAILVLAALAFFWPPDDRPRDLPGDSRPSAKPTPPSIDAPAAVQLRTSPQPAVEAASAPAQPVATAGRTPAAGPRKVPVGQDVAPARDAVTRPVPSATPPVVEAVPPSNTTAGGAATQADGLRPLDPAPAATRPAPRPADAHAAGDVSSRPTDTAIRAGAPVSDARELAVAGAGIGVPDVALASMPPPPVPTDDELIRETLDRYADAYARLDVAAAQQVWPSVDAHALRRAFDGLASQGLSLERCELRVTGSDATAACRGRARYVPKVGDGEPLTLSRLWVFTLRRGEAGWTIRTADAR